MEDVCEHVFGECRWGDKNQFLNVTYTRGLYRKCGFCDVTRMYSNMVQCRRSECKIYAHKECFLVDLCKGEKGTGTTVNSTRDVDKNEFAGTLRKEIGKKFKKIRGGIQTLYQTLSAKTRSRGSDDDASDIDRTAGGTVMATSAIRKSPTRPIVVDVQLSPGEKIKVCHTTGWTPKVNSFGTKPSSVAPVTEGFVDHPVSAVTVQGDVSVGRTLIPTDREASDDVTECIRGDDGHITRARVDDSALVGYHPGRVHSSVSPWFVDVHVEEPDTMLDAESTRQTRSDYRNDLWVLREMIRANKERQQLIKLFAWRIDLPDNLQKY